jgi:lipopolysaccharide biosynthesis protein
MYLTTLLRTLRGLVKRALHRYYPFHGKVVGVLRRHRRYIIERFDGEDPCRGSRSVAIFCHYDGKGIVHPYVEYYLKSLVVAGFRVHVVSNAPHLSRVERAKLAPLCTSVILRRNVGHDFGAYKEAILGLPDRHAIDRLLVANDSVYGPLNSLDAVVSRMSPDVADVWGLTDSFEIRYHLQSYFLLFHAAALRDPSFEAFWKEVPFSSMKWSVIHCGEVGLTQRLAAAGLRMKCLYPYEDVTARFQQLLRESRALTREDIRAEHRERLRLLADAVDAGIPLNPANFFWEVLINHMSFPFIKRDLLEVNPAQLPGVSRWRELVRARSDYDTELIARHQKLRLKNRSL